MAKRGAFKVKFIMPAKFKKFIDNPEPAVQDTLKEAHKEVREFLKKKISDAAPKKSGKLAQSILESEKGNKIFTKLPYSRAVELGHYAEAKNWKLLIWSDGGQVVSKRFVRTKKNPYFFNTFHESTLEALNIYDRHYAKLLESITT